MKRRPPKLRGSGAEAATCYVLSKYWLAFKHVTCLYRKVTILKLDLGKYTSRTTSVYEKFQSNELELRKWPSRTTCALKFAILEPELGKCPTRTEITSARLFVNYVRGRPLTCFAGPNHCKPIQRKKTRYPQKPSRHASGPSCCCKPRLRNLTFAGPKPIPKPMPNRYPTH